MSNIVSQKIRYICCVKQRCKDDVPNNKQACVKIKLDKKELRKRNYNKKMLQKNRNMDRDYKYENIQNDYYDVDYDSYDDVDYTDYFY